MSMRDYAVNDYGLLLTEETLRIIASKVCNNYTDEAYKEDEFAFKDSLYDKGIVDKISEFTGEAFAINDIGETLWFTSDFFDYDMIWFVHTKKISMLFRAAYRDMDELINEFKERLGEYLPADFDYRNNIRHISGTYYG